MATGGTCNDAPVTPNEAAAPEWFTDALAAPSDDVAVTVDGCPVNSRRWGQPGRPGIVLVHGGGANSHWWDHLAPLIARDEYRVAAIDLSGHGDSGRRSDYTHGRWAEEVLAVAHDAEISGPPIVIAHSMGGWVAITAAATYGDALAGIMILDTPVWRLAPEEQAAKRREAFGPLRTYPTLDAALERYRTVPDQPTSLPYVVDHIARNSARRTADGWTWKFDPEIFAFRLPTGDTLQRVTSRVALFRSQNGLVTADIGDYMYEQLGRVAPVIEIPLAWHHVMLDQPLPLLVGLRTLLADWEHSDPYRRS